MLPALPPAHNFHPPIANLIQADTDGALIDLRLHGRPATTIRAYTKDTALFFGVTGRPILQTPVGDIQRWMDSLTALKSVSRERRLAAIRRLFGFAHRVGYVAFIVTAPVRLRVVCDHLAQRIVPEAAMHRLLALTPPGRNHVMLRLLYASG